MSCCCWKHPTTEESVELVLDDGRVVYTCPYLAADGTCTDFEARTQPCYDYIDCPCLRELDVYELMGFDCES